MLLDEDPATVGSRSANSRIRECPEKYASIDIFAEKQVKPLTLLIELSRNLQTLTTQHHETISSHNTTDHASQIVELDTQKFRVAKAASDLEIDGERLEQELDNLKGRLQQLELQSHEGDDTTKAKRELEDPTVLKLKVYRSLGIDVDPDKAGTYNKATIRNTQQGDVHVVNIDANFSRFFYANYFWQTMG
ncbi:MAG: hypothetical protein Q9186_001507 [Xanthomendoza sp. 1 TL-2023]